MSVPVFGVYYDIYYASYGTVDGVSPLDDASGVDVVALVEAPDVIVEAGLDLLDGDDNFVLDISDDLQDGDIEHSNFRTIHTTCKLQITRRLPPSARVRPRVRLTSLTLNLTREWNMGVFLLDPPEVRVAESPQVFGYEGFDKLVRLGIPTARDVTLEAGSGYLDFAVSMIVEAGEDPDLVLFDFDPDVWLLAPDQPRTWQLGDQTTWLRVVNDCLDAVGGRGCWTDRDGRFRSERYQAPSGRSSEWVFDADDDDTIVGEDRFELAVDPPPNVWVFFDDDATKGTPTVANGRKYVVENPSDGPWSIDQVGRNPRIVPLDAADATSLQLQGDRIAALDMRTPSTRQIPSALNPELWHMAVIDVRDNALGGPKKMQDIGWTVFLDGRDMVRTSKEA